MPEQCENGGVIESRRRGEPAELPGILNKWEILAVKGNEAGSDRKKKQELIDTKNRNNKTRGEKHCSLSVFSVRCSVTLLRGLERGDEENIKLYLI